MLSVDSPYHANMNTDRESTVFAALPEEIILQIVAICSVRDVLSLGCVRAQIDFVARIT